MRVRLARGHGCFRLLILTFSLCYSTHTLNDATLCDVYVLCAATFGRNIVHGMAWGGGELVGVSWGLRKVSRHKYLGFEIVRLGQVLFVAPTDRVIRIMRGGRPIYHYLTPATLAPPSPHPPPH
jgi:hypothetical protein